MKQKLLTYAAVPLLGLGLLGAGVASAHSFFGFGANLTPDQIATRQQSMFQHEADILGISVDDVKNAWASGKTMQQLMTEKGISQDQVTQRMKDARIQQLKDGLQALVSKGVITQTQADNRLQFVQNQAAHASGGGMGMGMHMRGFGHFGF